jgi:hypothetical protein
VCPSTLQLTLHALTHWKYLHLLLASWPSAKASTKAKVIINTNPSFIFTKKFKQYLLHCVILYKIQNHWILYLLEMFVFLRENSWKI